MSMRRRSSPRGWCPAYLLASLFLAENLGAAPASAQPGQDGDCSRLVRAADARNGSVSSPGYPAPYPPGLECSFTFMATGTDRLRLVFKDFDLYQFKDNDPDDCTGDDAVIPAIEIDGEQTNIQTYCGQKLPPGLMSSGPHMTLTFKSVAKPRHTKVTNRGFLARFQFVDNYGIDAEQSSSHPCGFVYNSTRRAQGTFTSPNYPGLYPRNIECQYFFKGRAHERVRLTFAYFDVEGIYPCQAETDSDYVEFSNFQTIDRKMPRYCGPDRNPNVVVSDGGFFRVTFKSNHLFDATGFEAFYQFFNETSDGFEGPIPTKRKTPTEKGPISTKRKTPTEKGGVNSNSGSGRTLSAWLPHFARFLICICAISRIF